MKQEDKEILAGVVVDPDAWDAHQRAHFIAKHGPEEGTKIADANLAAKVARWKPDVEARKTKFGQDYKTRAVLQDEQDEQERIEITERVKEMKAEETRKREELKAEILAELRAAR